MWGPQAFRGRWGCGKGAKVNEKGLLQVSLSYYHLKRDPGEECYAKERTGVVAGNCRWSK